MTRNELVRAAHTALVKNDVRKSVISAKKVFHVSDEDGVSQDFVVRSRAAGVLYNIGDVDVILEALTDAVLDALKHGDCITIRGIGTLGLRYMPPHKQILPLTGEEIDVPGRYLPKFVCGNVLKRCAASYTDYVNGVPPSSADFEETDEDEGEDGGD